MAAQSLVPREAIDNAMTCGDDVEEHIAQVLEYVDAGYDEVYVQQIGPDLEGFFDAWSKDVLPAFR
jgi:hypothetical protein